jgi:hypothetical protein
MYTTAQDHNLSIRAQWATFLSQIAAIGTTLVYSPNLSPDKQ